jgi:hypothetical protein
MLAEHGTLGILHGFVGFHVLPWFCIWKTVSYVLFCALSLLVLTINHAAMRTAVPLCVFLGFIERANGDDRKV